MLLERWAAEVSELVSAHGSLRKAADFCRSKGLDVSHNTLGDWRRQKAKNVDAYVEAMARVRGRDPGEYWAWLNGRSFSANAETWADIAQKLSTDELARAELIKALKDDAVYQLALECVAESARRNRNN